MFNSSIILKMILNGKFLHQKEQEALEINIFQVSILSKWWHYLSYSKPDESRMIFLTPHYGLQMGWLIWLNTKKQNRKKYMQLKLIFPFFLIFWIQNFPMYIYQLYVQSIKTW